MLKEKEVCPNCNQLRYMSRHHVKNIKGEKTGEIQRMCRDCHDEIEEEYRLYGVIKSSPPKKSKMINLTSYSNKEWDQPIQPFYATKQSVNNRASNT